MQSARNNNRQPKPREEGIFHLMPDPSLMSMLWQALRESGNEIGGGFGSYLRAAFLPDRIQDWFPLRVASEIGTALAHPLEFAAGAAATDEIGRKWRRRLAPMLAASFAVHGALIVYLIYLALFAAFGNRDIVDEPYRKFDPTMLTVHLKYPPQMLKGPQSDKTLTLEEIREKARKRREELARERTAREEKEKAEREKAEKERQEAEKAAAELAEKEKEKEKPKDGASVGLGKLNVAPIKDIVGQFYALYTAGNLDVNVTNLSVMAGFKIEKDGSLSGIRIIKSSGNKVVDEKAAQILWMIGESHALSDLSDLSSGSVKLDLTESTSKLTITAFAATPDVAKAKADFLNAAFWVLRLKKNSPEVNELLSLVRVKSDNKRVDAELSMSRARATRLMNASFGETPPQ